MKLQMMTRGNSSSKGKMKVYISCYGKQTGKYVQMIGGWILDIRNYAIFYSSDEVRGQPEDADVEFSQLNCMIIPVDHDLLSVNNPSVLGFQFAKEHGIPVVPVLMEKHDTPAFYDAYLTEAEAVQGGWLLSGYGMTRLASRNPESGTRYRLLHLPF